MSHGGLILFCKSNLKIPMRILIPSFIILFLLITLTLNAAEHDLIDLGKLYIKNGEYYNAITEIKRYQYLYPEGRYYPLCMIILGEAYFKGGNYYNAVSSLTECYRKYPERKEGEEALFNLGNIRLISGSPFFAYRNFQEYDYIYKKGRFREEVALDKCYSKALMGDFKGAKREITNYRNSFENGLYLEDVKKLDLSINNELNRTKKSLWVSIVGSAFIPGFGYLYTEKYKIGIFTFCMNASLIYLIYDAYRDRNRFRMILFSLVEFSFYQYSIFSAINNVYEYNSKDEFYKTVRLGLRRNY